MKIPFSAIKLIIAAVLGGAAFGITLASKSSGLREKIANLEKKIPKFH